MELEKLNRTQTILLALLVAFVSSIASSIVTVTLMDQAPPGTTTTIRNVVERTVERVVQGNTTPKETVKTVIVREEDIIADAVDRESRALARVFTQALPVADSATSTSEFVSLGIILSEDGTIVTDSATVSESATYTIKLADGTTFDAKPTFQNEDLHIAFLQPVKPLEKKLISATLGDSETARFGGMAVVIGGKNDVSVNIGVVSGFDTSKKEIEKDGKKEEVVYRSNIRLSIGTGAGSLVVSGSGSVIAMGTGPEGSISAVPINLIKELLASIPPAKTTQ